MTSFNSDRVLAIARRQAFVLQRAPQRWFDVIVWPVVDAILFGAIGVYFGEQAADGGAGGAAAGAAFLLAGIPDPTTYKSTGPLPPKPAAVT